MIAKGSKVNGRYQIIKTIGEGGMANVYLAYDLLLDRNVAIKVLRGDLSGDEKFVRRFKREAQAASNLSHPNIVEMYDVGEEDDSYYIVMEFIDGKTLKQLLKKRGKLSVNETIDIMLQLTDGIACAHDLYIIHRDIKPQNIMILENGLIKITDFGIATALNSTQLTQTNSVMGSVHYLPPEQANGKGATIKSDIYSMGILMYELLAGNVPYKGDNAVEIALKHMKEPLPSIKKILPDLPTSIENIILKATAKNPKNRYNDARCMHEDLKTCLLQPREDEKRIVYKYSETDLEETKVIDEALIKQESKNMENKKQEKLKSDEKKDEEAKSSSKLLIILASVFTSLIVITATIIVLLPKLMETKDVKIPDVSTKTVVEASNILTKLGFNVNEETVATESDEIEVDYVVKTSPQAGKIVKEGSAVTLYVSVGDGSFILDDYTNKNYIEVQTLLRTKYDCKTDIEYEEVEDKTKYKEDFIIRTSPSAGQTIKKDVNCKVTLILPNFIAKYPLFTDGNYTLSKIQDFCDKNELTLKVVYEENALYEEGTIIKQSRPYDTVVAPGTTLTITVSTLPKDNGENMVEDESGLE